jgi:hypothetical protein
LWIASKLKLIAMTLIKKEKGDFGLTPISPLSEVLISEVLILTVATLFEPYGEPQKFFLVFR